MVLYSGHCHIHGPYIEDLLLHCNYVTHLASPRNCFSQEISLGCISKERVTEQQATPTSARNTLRLAFELLSPDKVAKGPETLRFCPLLAPAKFLLQALHVIEAAAAALDAAADEGICSEHRLKAAIQTLGRMQRQLAV